MEPSSDYDVLKEKVAKVSNDLADFERRNSNTHERIFDRLTAIETQAAVRSEQYNHIIKKLDDLSAKVDALEAKPAKNWETLIGIVISCIVGAVVGAMLAGVGL